MLAMVVGSGGVDGGQECTGMKVMVNSSKIKH